MRIQILVPAEQWLDRAGVRIRYRRIAPFLERLGSKIAIDPIGSVHRTSAGVADVVILSKCHDSRGLGIAEELRARGSIVGIDLFDDYFSPTTSMCLANRTWLREIAPQIDFFLCSTPRMKDVGAAFSPGKPVHVLNDPFDTHDLRRLGARLAEKQAKARADRRFDVLWFGNGDNPIFPVGVSDLAAFGSALRPLVNQGFDVRLKVLTNLRALGGENLARLRRLPVAVSAREWSEELEKQMLDAALTSFIPVNFQRFSIAKSLNRGISALTNGTQILSAGFPLYADLAPFVYRDAGLLLDDLVNDRLLLRPDTVNALAAKLAGLADPAQEAAALQKFLAALVVPAPASRHRAGHNRAILHGSQSSSAAHVFARAMGWFSLASPLTIAARTYDAVFMFHGVGTPPTLRLSRLVYDALRPEHRNRAHALDGADDRGLAFELPLPATPAGRVLANLPLKLLATKADRIIQYGRIMDATLSVYHDLLEHSTITRSEQESPLTGLVSGAVDAAL